jgi:hypothetical protein
MRTRAHFTLLAFVMLALAGCSDDAPPTKVTPVQGGDLQVRLKSPPASVDSGIVFVLMGPTPATASSASGALQLFQRISGDSTVVALIGPLSQGTVLVTVHIPNINIASSYRVGIRSVASGDGELRDLTDYSLTISP